MSRSTTQQDTLAVQSAQSNRDNDAFNPIGFLYKLAPEAAEKAFGRAAAAFRSGIQSADQLAESEAQESSSIIQFPGNGFEAPSKMEEPEPVEEQQTSVHSGNSEQETTVSGLRSLGFWYSELDECRLSRSGIAVLTHLIRRCGNPKSRCRLSMSAIAEARGVSLRTVIRAVEELEDAGIVEVKRVFGSVNYYRIRSREEWEKWKQTSDKFVTGDKRDSGSHETSDKNVTGIPDHLPVTPMSQPSDKRDTGSRGASNTLSNPISNPISNKSARVSNEPKKKAKEAYMASESEIIEIAAAQDPPISNLDAIDMLDRRRATGGMYKDWGAALRNWRRSGWLLSQKQSPDPKDPVQLDSSFEPPTEQTVVRYARGRGLSDQLGSFCWKHWTGNAWKHYSQPITSDQQWKCLLETEMREKFDRMLR